MRKTFVLSIIIGLGLLAAAQQQNTPPANASPPDQVTVRGCLTGAVHRYRLVDEKQIVYLLRGDDKQLSGFDDRQVEVTGKVEVNIPPKAKQTASSFSRPEHRLTVTSISKVDDTCGGASE